jgi:glutathione S-transferase
MKGACSLAVRILLHELNQPCEYEAVFLETKKTETGADFLQINPLGNVPTLVLDDKTILTENAVVQQYLADTNHATQLLPPVGDFKRYRVLEWLNFITTELHKGFAPLFNPTLSDELKQNYFKPKLVKHFSYIDQYLKGKEFLLDKQFTIADCYLFVMLLWTGHFKISLQTFPELTRYFAALKTRPAIAASLQEEGL